MTWAHALKRCTKHNNAVTLVEYSGQAWERQTKELVEKRSASRLEAKLAVLENNRNMALVDKSGDLLLTAYTPLKVLSISQAILLE